MGSGHGSIAGSVALTVAIALATASVSRADEGGVSFWLPGTFGSLAAVPGTPGWTLGAVYYHASVDAGAAKNFRIGGAVQAGLEARPDLALLNATYVFATPVFGARASLGLIAVVGRNDVAVDATLTGPRGNTISGRRQQEITGFGDLFPRGTLAWNHGVHNVMVYTQWGIPVGAYDPNRIANLGLGHAAADGGAGYTYFNPQTGWEFSVVGGLTYNFRNPDTDYRNGVSAHVEWAASKFLSQQIHAGVVGYLYNQLTGDSGSGATLGPFKSRVVGVGPQLGYIFPVAGMQGYLNVKGYYEFAAENRPEGWNVWLTLAVSPAPPSPAAPSQLIRK